MRYGERQNLPLNPLRVSALCSGGDFAEKVGVEPTAYIGAPLFGSLLGLPIGADPLVGMPLAEASALQQVIGGQVLKDSARGVGRQVERDRDVGGFHGL